MYLLRIDRVLISSILISAMSVVFNCSLCIWGRPVSFGDGEVKFVVLVVLRSLNNSSVLLKYCLNTV